GRAEPPDAIARMLGEPQIAVGTGGDSCRPAVRMRQGDVRDFSIGCDAPNPITDRVGEPHCAVRACGYSFGESVGIDREAFGGAVRSHPPDAVALELGED